MRDYGDMSIRERVELQLKTLDDCISNLSANLRSVFPTYRSTLESANLPADRAQLGTAADNALGVLKGTRALLAEVIPNLKELEELPKKLTPRPRTRE
jgi:hypothetical protein